MPIRMSVCNAFLSEPYLREPFVQKIENFSTINIPTEVVQQKNQYSILPKSLEVVAKKKNFLNLCFAQASSQ